MSHPVSWPTVAKFYPYGNTPPVSLVRDLPPEVDADILLLGCGDPIDILFTLHSDIPIQGARRRKLDFTCCDIEPAVLARNILLFTLVVREDFPANGNDLWKILYHYFLDDESLSLLIAQSKVLFELSRNLETWRTGPYSSFIEIGTSFTLRELRRHWKWYADTQSLPKDRKRTIHRTFTSRLKEHPKEFRGYVFTQPAGSAGPMWPNAALLLNEAHHRYAETGLTALAAEDPAAAVHYNPTFAYSNGQEGFVRYQSHSPYTSFLPAASFNPLDDADLQELPRPTLQGLKQAVREQFFAWCEALRRRVKAKTVTIRMIAGDALALCRTILELARYDRHSAQCRVAPWRAPMLVLDGDGYRRQALTSAAPTAFDVIDTSTLWDHLGILNIIAVATPLLKRRLWVTMYTEIGATYGVDCTKDFLHSLHVDLSTISLLFDLVPVPYLSGFRSDSNLQDLLAPSTIANFAGFHERLPWRRPSAIVPDLSLPDASFILDEKELIECLQHIMGKMYAHEISAPPDESTASQKERSRAHYNRASLALILACLIPRIRVDWETIFNAIFD